jgi:Ni,Fe-hydrogenase I cytochrome b subunit
MIYLLLTSYMFLQAFISLCHQFVTFLHILGEIMVIYCYLLKNKIPANALFTGILAEREGFEPSVRY